MDLLLDRPPFVVGGAAIGLLIVATLALLNQRLGVSGGFAEVIERIGERRVSFGWKSWFLFGIVGGALAFVLLAGGQTVGDGYGWLTRELESELAVGALLVGGGVLIGYGAKFAGGCTSGHGMSGCAAGSPDSFATTVTFFSVAVLVTLGLNALTGGAL